MADTMNYDQLVAAVQAYLENTFPQTIGTTSMTSTEQINRFILEAERRIFNSVQIPNLRKNVTGCCAQGNPYLTAPDDWLANYSLAVIDSDGLYTYLINKDVSFIRESYPDPTDYAAPKFYAVFDDNTYIIGPTPDARYDMELHYFYYPESIVDAETSWLGTYHSPALLHGTLLEAAIFMKEEVDVIANYQKRYDDALMELKQLGDAKNRQDNYRTTQVRYPVV